ncbi:MAG: lanthionine synthetase LanC family protein, partial [Actinomycetes bacterium]
MPVSADQVRPGRASPGAEPWTSPLPPALAEEALAAALELATRCTDPDGVRAANELCQRQTLFPNTLHWDPVSVAQGDLGQALLCGELHQLDPNAGWDRVGAAHVSTASAFLRRGYRPPMGTVSGSSGVAFVARRRADPQLAPVLPGLDAAIAQDALGTAASIRGRTGISVSTFDQISGLSGVLLCALPHDEQPAAPVAPFVVKALAALALESNGTPAWYTPPEHLYDDEQRHYYPYGNVNLGLAHGIPGPLAALALAAREGVAADEASAAAAVLGQWLAE